jgi:hypothetical protein
MNDFRVFRSVHGGGRPLRDGSAEYAIFIIGIGSIAIACMPTQCGTPTDGRGGLRLFPRVFFLRCQ